jgi:hypothetical protein
VAVYVAPDRTAVVQRCGQDAPLRSIVRELAGPRQAIEQSFLQMGEGLAACVGLLETVSATHEALPAEFGSSEFTATEQTLADIRVHVNAIATAHLGEKDHVGALADTAAGLARPLSDLRATVRAIGQIALNARILAAGFGTSNEDVAAFTSDMASLARMVHEAVEAFSQCYDRLNKLLSVARDANPHS